MKIGIWFPIWPLSEWKYEGLTRLLGFMLSGMRPEHGNVYTICVPYWVDDEDIEEFLQKFTPEQRSRLKIGKYGTWNIPFYFAMRILRRRKDLPRMERASRRKKKALRNMGRRRMRKFSQALLGALRWSVPGVLLLLLVLSFGGLLALFALPFVIVLLAGKWLFGRLGGRGGRGGPHLAHLRHRKEALFRLIPGHAIMNGLVSVFRDLAENELRRLARRAGRLVDVDCWYVPHTSYGSGRFLPSPRVFLFADFVFHDAPTGFPPELIAMARKNVKKVLSNAEHVICISEHVKRRHVIGVFGYPEERTTVIRHGYVDISHLLPFLHRDEGEAASFARVRKTRESLERAAEIVKAGLVRIHFRNRHAFGPVYATHVFPYLRKIDFSRERFALISTQNRPYKNTLGVMKAVELHNRRARRPLKLIMTGDAGIDDPDNPIGAYIREHGLYYDVLSIPRVPDVMHAALYHCATLAIAGTFFEGGSGSFVFDEAVSVGTPVLLSRNLAHDEEFRRYEEYREFSFNPYEPEQLADLMDAVLSGGVDALHEKQWRIARERHDRRPWSLVHEEYLGVFREVSNACEAKA